MFFLNKKSEKLNIIAPVDCEIIELNKVNDEVFSKKMLGDGFAIIPKSGNFIAPISGKLITVFPTGHAYGIKNNNNIELLLHIGINTVLLKGEGFDVKVKQYDNVKQGDLLCNVNLNILKNKNIESLDTPIIFISKTIINKKINIIKMGNVKQGEIIAVIK